VWTGHYCVCEDERIQVVEVVVLVLAGEQTDSSTVSNLAKEVPRSGARHFSALR
jgi:hypothetical protein